MLSILVNDALMGIDISTKYPATYAMMLRNQTLRAAFLETLELLEQSRAGELLDYSGPKNINLDFLNEICCNPIIHQLNRTESEFTWQIPAAKLQKSFTAVHFHPNEDCCNSNLFLEESPINLFQSQIPVNNCLSRVRLDLLPSPDTLESLRLILSISPPPEANYHTEAAITWGTFRQTADVNEWGLARFSNLEPGVIFDAYEEVINSLTLRLGQRY